MSEKLSKECPKMWNALQFFGTAQSYWDTGCSLERENERLRKENKKQNAMIEYAIKTLKISRSIIESYANEGERDE